MPTDLSESARNDRLNNRATFVVQQMYLIDDQQLDFLRNGPAMSRTRPQQGSNCSYRCDLAFASRLASDDIPFLWCGHDDLCLRDLALSELHIT